MPIPMPIDMFEATTQAVEFSSCDTVVPHFSNPIVTLYRHDPYSLSDSRVTLSAVASSSRLSPPGSSVTSSLQQISREHSYALTMDRCCSSAASSGAAAEEDDEGDHFGETATATSACTTPRSVATTSHSTTPDQRAHSKGAESFVCFPRAEEFILDTPPPHTDDNRLRNHRRHHVGAAQDSAAKRQAASPGTTHHFARMQFKFSSAFFVASFRVANGDHVVACDASGVQHIGVVRNVTTDCPEEFLPWRCDAMHTLPRLVRHARPADRSRKHLLVSRLEPQMLQLLQASQHVSLAPPPSDVEVSLDGACLTVRMSSPGCIDYDTRGVVDAWMATLASNLQAADIPCSVTIVWA